MPPSSARGGRKCRCSRECSLDGIRENRLVGPSGERVEMKPPVILSLYAPDTYIWYSKKRRSNCLLQEGNCLLVSGKRGKIV